MSTSSSDALANGKNRVRFTITTASNSNAVLNKWGNLTAGKCRSLNRDPLGSRKIKHCVVASQETAYLPPPWHGDARAVAKVESFAFL